jgi:hypothetical protein
MTLVYRKHAQMYFDSNEWGHFIYPINSHEMQFIQFAPGTRLGHIKGYIARTSADYVKPFSTLLSSTTTTTTTTIATTIINEQECQSIMDEYYIILLILIQVAFILILVNITIVTWQKYLNYQKHNKKFKHQPVQNNKLKVNNPSLTNAQEPPYYYEIVDIIQQDLV